MSEHTWGEGSEAPGVVRCTERGLPAVRAESSHGALLVFRQGAHVAEYRPAQAPAVLWVSQHSRFAPGSAIRGGVPICFPWFGAHVEKPSLPAHGFARTSEFEYAGSVLVADRLVLTFELESDQRTRELWPADFRVRYVVTLGERLTLALTVENRGVTPIEYEEALHTYFAVSDVRSISIEGLAGARYTDKVSGNDAVQSETDLRISAETDRVYASAAPCTLLDPGLGRCITVDKSGSQTTVVWNPWLDKARRLSDFGDDEYPSMVCVESANTHGARVRLFPGQAHELVVSLESAPLGD